MPPPIRWTPWQGLRLEAVAVGASAGKSGNPVETGPQSKDGFAVEWD
ncbi:MAG: hypothetical protein LAT55_13510 [Opitutales bacterium]|nr:hypothetical protein [Opitutales bacterium]